MKEKLNGEKPHTRKDHRQAQGSEDCAGTRWAVTYACSRIVVTETNYHRWYKEYGGLMMEQARLMKGQARENGRLRREALDLTLDKLILQNLEEEF